MAVTGKEAWLDVLRSADATGTLEDPSTRLEWASQKTSRFMAKLKDLGHIFARDEGPPALTFQAEPPAKINFTLEFGIIWGIYPRKVAKGDGLKHYKARRNGGVPFRTLYDATRQYALSRKGEDDKFSLHAGTFFGPTERWKDYNGSSTGNGNAKPERTDGRWQPPMKDLTKKSLQETIEEQATDHSPTKEPETGDPLADL
jgi:cytochrome c1